MSKCTNQAATEANYRTDYPSSPTWSCIKAITFSGQTRSSSTASYGSELELTAINSAHITSLLEANDAVAPVVITAVSLTPAQTYADNARNLREKIQNEYCYYLKAYQFSLNKLFTVLIAPTSANQYNDALRDRTVSLNDKLTKIIEVMQKLNASRGTSLEGLYSATVGSGTRSGSNVNGLNNELQATKEQLIQNSDALKNKYLEKDVKVAMIDYTLEKNSSSSNLLAIYGFMNIVAIGMLYYLYRSSRV